MLTFLITNKIVVLLLLETKIDETFLLEQFLISGFAKPLRLDRNSRGGSITFFIRDNIPSRLSKPGNFPSNTEALGANSEITESLHEFCNRYNLHNLWHKFTCYKNPEKPSRTDPFLTSSHRSFQNTQTIETGLSDFHKSVVPILKMYLPNNQPKVATYRGYKSFGDTEEILSEIKKLEPLNKNICIFHNACIEVLDILHKIMKFSIKDFFMWPNPQFTEEILNGKHHFLGIFWIAGWIMLLCCTQSYVMNF